MIRRGFPHPSGRTDSAPKPDVCVHPHTLPPQVTEVRLADYGPPHLIIEVASESTWTIDVTAKATSYAQGGVADYMVVDVDGTLLPEPVQAWHLRRDGRLIPWQSDAAGRWQTGLGFSLALDGFLVRVYDAAGQRVPTFLESQYRRQDLEARLAQMEEEMARLRAEGADR